MKYPFEVVRVLIEGKQAVLKGLGRMEFRVLHALLSMYHDGHGDIVRDGSGPRYVDIRYRGDDRRRSFISTLARYLTRYRDYKTVGPFTNYDLIWKAIKKLTSLKDENGDWVLRYLFPEEMDPEKVTVYDLIGVTFNEWTFNINGNRAHRRSNPTWVEVPDDLVSESWGSVIPILAVLSFCLQRVRNKKKTFNLRSDTIAGYLQRRVGDVMKHLPLVKQKLATAGLGVLVLLAGFQDGLLKICVS